MMATDEEERRLVRFRTNTRAASQREDWQAVIDQVAAFEAWCDKHFWPDWWADMDRLRRDAEAELRREHDDEN